MNNKLRYKLHLYFFKENKFFGPGIAEFLWLVDERGSLRTACKEMDMAYSKAWRIVKTASAELGFPLINAQTGGKGGGGAQLTPEGRTFLEKYTTMNQALQNHAETLFQKLFES